MPDASALSRLDPAQRADATLARGAALFDRHACASCHRGNASGKRLAALGSRYSQTALDALLTSPPASMPAPAVDDADRRALAAYLRAA